jgi:hypothetical protein
MVTNKQLEHYKMVLQSGLDKFLSCCDKLDTDYRQNLIRNDWERLISDTNKIKYIANYVNDFSSLAGFTREFSNKLTYEQLVGRSAERFAEFDLAAHAIREFNLKASKLKLEKVTESNRKTCDFKLNTNPPYYLEAKYTVSPTKNNICSITREALEQIKTTEVNTDKKGCIWISTYQGIDNPRKFQTLVENIKRELANEYDFRFTLNIQVYSRDLFGDGSLAIIGKHISI